MEERERGREGERESEAKSKKQHKRCCDICGGAIVSFLPVARTLLLDSAANRSTQVSPIPHLPVACLCLVDLVSA